jgi:hypothetical protein
MAFLSGGGLMGLSKELVKNTIFEFGSQYLASGFDFNKAVRNMDLFYIVTGTRFSKIKGAALVAGLVDFNLKEGLTFIGGPGNYEKSTESAISDSLIQVSVGSISNTKPFLQESILEISFGFVAQKISEGWDLEKK